MKMLHYASGVQRWAKTSGVKLECYSFNETLPTTYEIQKIKGHLPALSALFEDNNGIRVVWRRKKDQMGLLVVPEADELNAMIDSEKKIMQSYDDDFILNRGHDRDWWSAQLPLYRSLIKFYDEGNGDGIFISSMDNGIYFVFHDWMDWIGSEPPIVKLAGSLEELYDSWSKIQFAMPKDLYWMSAVRDGKFTGFNSTGFVTK